MGGASNNNGGSSNSSSATASCGVFQIAVFLVAIVTGTACSICSKTMMSLHAVGMNGDVEAFSKPLFQTFGMFIGMCFGLVMHGAVLVFKIPFPGYEHTMPVDGTISAPQPTVSNYGAIESGETDKLLPPSTTMAPKRTPIWLYFFLAVPAIFDVGATMLCMMGLVYIDVSIYQLLRGSGIIFVALMKQHVLGDKLYTFQWVGVVWNVVSVFLVGGTAILNSADAGPEDIDIASASAAKYGGNEALLGVLLVMLGAFVQAMQFVFEEKVMTMEDAAPPLLLIGMEGVWGTFICLFILYPLAYNLPGDDHGRFEDGFNTMYMVMHSSTIQTAFVIYFFAIFGYNLFAVLVTFSLNSIWHAILDNFRPITVWGIDMFIFYGITSSFGEPWTKYAWIQVLGMTVLLYGTAVYNAPNAGSIRLEGQWYVFGLNFRHEYEEVEKEMLEEPDDMSHDEWERRQGAFGQRRSSSMAEHTPYVSLHTQALRGLAAPKIYKNAKIYEKIMTI